MSTTKASFIQSYILTYNAPGQLLAFLSSMKSAAPELFIDTEVIVVNQSTIDSTQPRYQAICEAFGVKMVNTLNAGASGGRVKCAHRFHESGAKYMYYFEDDIIFSNTAKRCRFGFPSWLNQLHERCHSIIDNDKLDFLKLTFHEVYCDHSRNFVTGQLSRLEIRHSANTCYFAGEVYYSNWPMIISQSGSRLLFTELTSRPSEGDISLSAHRMIERGELHVGVLAAWPLVHNRSCDRGDKVDTVPITELEQHPWLHVN